MEEEKKIINLNKNYVSLSYQMIADLINSKSTPLYIRFKLYFGVLQRYNNEILCLNDYLSRLFKVSNYQVKYHLKKLKEDGSIRIENPNSYRRKIVLLDYVIIKENQLSTELKKQQEKLRQSAFGKFAVKDNVYLTDSELYELKELMKNEYVVYINNLNNYIEEKKINYESHFEVLKAWWYKNQKAKKRKKKQEETPEYLEDISYTYEGNIFPETEDELKEWLKDFEKEAEED